MELTGQKREKIGKAVKSLRADGLIPAVVFGNEIDSTAIVINNMAFAKVFDAVGETGLIDLKIDDATNAHTYKVLVNDVQYNPITGRILHAGFYKPNLKVRTEVHIPIEVVGEETNPLVKSGEGVVLQLMNEILVSALPTDLPEAFVVDVSGLAELGAHVTVGDLSYNREKVEILHLEATELVVKLDNAVMDEEPEEAAASVDGAEVSEQDKIAAMEATAEKKAEEEESEEK